jgi:hypothetical protein
MNCVGRAICTPANHERCHPPMHRTATHIGRAIYTSCQKKNPTASTNTQSAHQMQPVAHDNAHQNTSVTNVHTNESDAAANVVHAPCTGTGAPPASTTTASVPLTHDDGTITVPTIVLTNVPIDPRVAPAATAVVPADVGPAKPPSPLPPTAAKVHNASVGGKQASSKRHNMHVPRQRLRRVLFDQLQPGTVRFVLILWAMDSVIHL